MDGLCIAHEHASLRIGEASLCALIRHVLAREARALTYLGVILTDSAAIRALNRQYRGGDYDTDVLSFPLGEAGAIDGEVYVSLDYAAGHCAEFGATFEEEVRRYVIHGLLHLMGYDDADTAGRQRMRRLEDRYLGHCAQLLHDALDDRGTLHDVEVHAGNAEVE